LNRIKILFNVPNLWWGGGMVNALAVIRRLPPEEFECCCTYINAKPSGLAEMEQWGEVVQVPKGKPIEQHIAGLRAAMITLEPDVVQANTKYAAKVAKELGIPSVTKSGSLEGIEANGSEWADVTFRVSPAVPGDAPINLFGVDPVPWAEERREGLVVWLGRLDPDRNPLLFLEAMEILHKRGEKFSLRIIGGSPSGHIQIHKELHRRGLIGIAEALGTVPHPKAMALIAEGDVICAPWPEGSGTGVAEALTAGLIPVVPNSHYGPQLAANGKLGVMTAPNPEAVADAVQRALTDNNLRGKRRQIADRAIATWDNDRMAATYANTYRRLAGRAEKMGDHSEINDQVAELGVTHNDDDAQLRADGQIWDTTCTFGDYAGKSVAEHIANKPWSRHETRIEQWRNVDWLPGEPGQSVLDVGCGNANYYRYFMEVRGMVYTGCDNSQEMVRLAREYAPGATIYRARLPLDSMDGARLPFDNGSFDLVFCTNVLHHLPESEPALQELWRVTRRWLVVHQRAVAEGERIHNRGPHGEIVRLEPLRDVRAVMRTIDPNCAEHFMGAKHASRGLVEPYYVMTKTGAEP